MQSVMATAAIPIRVTINRSVNECPKPMRDLSKACVASRVAMRARLRHVAGIMPTFNEALQ